MASPTPSDIPSDFPSAASFPFDNSFNSISLTQHVQLDLPIQNAHLNLPIQRVQLNLAIQHVQLNLLYGPQKPTDLPTRSGADVPSFKSEPYRNTDRPSNREPLTKRPVCPSSEPTTRSTKRSPCLPHESTFPFDESASRARSQRVKTSGSTDWGTGRLGILRLLRRRRTFRQRCGQVQPKCHSPYHYKFFYKFH